jgi:hypothetical protein
MLKNIAIILFCIILMQNVAAQKFILSGNIRSQATGEDLTGATILLVNDPSQGAVTNQYGFYSITLPAGIHLVRFQFIGYEPVIIEIPMEQDKSLDVELKRAIYQLGDINVTGRPSDENVTSVEMGSIRMNPKEIENIPVIFGEPDLLKIIQLTAGVKPAGEGNTGFHVRGGGIDQNLILLDEAPVYNPSHLLGFFSVFNSEALKNADMMKGFIPAEYGGRASSVLDIQMKEGNLKELGVTGNLGMISSNMTLESPIIKDKGSFMISGRRTYADLFLKFSPNPDIRETHLYFYDFNLKTNFRINSKNRIYISGYLGRDDFDYKNNFRLDWGSATGTLRWNRIFSNRLFSNTTLVYSDYSHNISLVRDYNIHFRSEIKNFNLKQDFTWYINNQNTLKFGLNIIDHTILPGKINLSEAFGIPHPEDIPRRKAFEGAVYVSNEQQISERFRLYYGIRYSLFSNMGPGDFYEFDERGELINTIAVDKTSFYKTQNVPEPRLSVNFLSGNTSSVKASYTRMSQYLHLLSNTSTAVPTDIWLPSSNNVKPQISDQVSLGYFRNFSANEFETSLEVYYKDLKNQIEYRNATELVFNSTVEAELTFGRGWAYGTEMMLKRKSGRLNGWISYTWSKTMRQFDEVNNGKPFPARHDRTHDFSAVMMYDVFKRLKLSAAWVYYTGNAVTMPGGRYEIERKTVSYYTERNGFRMPDYHRLDVSLVLHGKKRDRFESSWNLSVYNVYGRENAFYIKFRNKEDNPAEMEAVQVSLFKAIPSLSYKFRF